MSMVHGPGTQFHHKENSHNHNCPRLIFGNITQYLIYLSGLWQKDLCDILHGSVLKFLISVHATQDLSSVKTNYISLSFVTNESSELVSLPIIVLVFYTHGNIWTRFLLFIFLNDVGIFFFKYMHIHDKNQLINWNLWQIGLFLLKWKSESCLGDP